MARRLVSNVFVDGQWFGPSYPDTGDPPEGSVDNEKVYEDGTDTPSATDLTPVSEPAAPIIDPDPDYVVDPPETTGTDATGEYRERHAVGADQVAGPPPKSGPGSSRARWLEYADGHGVRLRDDTPKEDIIAACETAGVRTE